MEAVSVPAFAGPQGILQALLDFVVGTEVTGESLGTGDGSTVTFTGTLAHYPVGLGRLVVTCTIGGQVLTAKDDGSGVLVGTHVQASSLTHDTGVYSVTFATAPDSGTSVTASYLYGEPGRDWRLLYTPRSARTSNGVSEGATARTLTIGTGNGSQTVWSGTATAAIAYNTFKITYTIGGVSYTAIDDGLGHITGPYVNSAVSTVSYTDTASYSITFTTPPDSTKTVSASYYTHATASLNVREMVIQNTGLSGQEDIKIGISEYYTLPTRFGWRFNGYIDFDPNANNGNAFWQNAIIAAGAPSISVWNGTMLMWVYSNRQRITGFIQTSSGWYQTFYIGFGNRICPASAYPYPYYIAGDQGSSRVDHNVTSSYHRWFINPSAAGAAYAMNPSNVLIQALTSNTRIRTNITGWTATGVVGGVSAASGAVVIPVYVYDPLDGIFLFELDGAFFTPCNLITAGYRLTLGAESYRVTHNVNAATYADMMAFKRE
jgi:hypothetical protein